MVGRGLEREKDNMQTAYSSSQPYQDLHNSLLQGQPWPAATSDAQGHFK